MTDDGTIAAAPGVLDGFWENSETATELDKEFAPQNERQPRPPVGTDR